MCQSVVSRFGRMVRDWGLQNDERPVEKTQPPLHGYEIHAAGAAKGAGDGLLSRELSPGVPSALSGLTTVFGMGTGVALTL